MCKDNGEMKILYITRKFPPSIGGMQRQSYEFYHALRKKEQVYLIAWRHSQKFLPLFLLIAFLKGLCYLWKYKIDLIQVGDLALVPLGFLFKLLSGNKVFSMSHGKDTYFNNTLYQYFMIKFAKKLDGIMCVSNFLRRSLLSKGLNPERVFVINNGINPFDYIGIYDRKIIKADIGFKYNIDLSNKEVILSVSRLVKKKGISKFVKNIFLNIVESVPNVVLLLVGKDTGKETKKEKADIINFEKVNNLKKRTFFLGNIKNRELLRQIYSISDMLIMPNIAIEGDSEGFGIVALEASMNKVPVVAFDVDGVSDAVKNGENGLLIKEGDNEGFAEAVKGLFENEKRRTELGARARKFVQQNYDWDILIDKYIEVLKKVQRA